MASLKLWHAVAGADTVEDRAWNLILGAARLARNGTLPFDGTLQLRAGDRGTACPARPGPEAVADLVWQPGAGWRSVEEPTCGQVRALFDLYLPLCRPRPGAPHVVAHLGQSIDGWIATASGDAQGVTGRENIRHLHRMRALSDAVLVGAGTVAADDPRLTTRLVAGPNPVRVLLDPRRRLAVDHRVFQDGAAETLLCCDRARLQPNERRFGQARLLGVPGGDAGLDLKALLRTLADRGIRRVFIEGGGATVSRFLEAGLLSRLQVAVAPLVIGTGRPGLRLPPPAGMAEALRPPVRLFRMGEDVLYDFDLTGGPGGQPAAPSAGETLARIG